MVDKLDSIALQLTNMKAPESSSYKKLHEMVQKYAKDLKENCKRHYECIEKNDISPWSYELSIYLYEDYKAIVEELETYK